VVILGIFKIGFVCTKRGEFVEDSRHKSNLGDLLFTILDLLFGIELADFTLISAIPVCHLRQMRGYYTRFWTKSQQKRTKELGTNTHEWTRILGYRSAWRSATHRIGGQDLTQAGRKASFVAAFWLRPRGVCPIGEAD
jgi:hypothetical protein